ncbi:MAG: hypothetical protein ACREB3_10115, partial [Burkholderiales bacterium]
MASFCHCRFFLVLQRFDAYTSRSEFDLVIAYHGSEPIGQAWGWALPATPPDGTGPAAGRDLTGHPEVLDRAACG